MRCLKLEHTSPKFKILYPEYNVGKKYLVLKGGRSSTKSWGVAQALIHFSREYDGLRVVCGREIQKSVADSSKKLLEDTINRLGIRDEFIVTKSYLEHRERGSTFTFMGLGNNVDAIKGLEGTDLFWAEEAASLSKESLGTLCPTIRKRGSKIIFTYNPVSPTTPVEALIRSRPSQCLVEHINYTEVTKYLSKEIIMEAEADKEADYDRYRWIWLGEYQAQSEDTFISLGSVEAALNRPPQLTNEPVVAGLDVAIFHDKCVLVIRQGSNIIHCHIWNQPDNMELVDEVVDLCNKYMVVKLAVDCNGQGAAIYQNLRHVMEESCIGVMSGSVARDQKKYVRIRDEYWGKIKDWLDDASIPAKYGDAFITDLTNIKFFYDDRGRYKIESKRSYISRGFHSTDWADALGFSLLINAKSCSQDFYLPQAERIVAYDRGFYSNYQSDWMGI